MFTLPQKKKQHLFAVESFIIQMHYYALLSAILKHRREHFLTYTDIQTNYNKVLLKTEISTIPIGVEYLSTCLKSLVFINLWKGTGGS